jgi:hypothetical protein
VAAALAIVVGGTLLLVNRGPLETGPEESGLAVAPARPEPLIVVGPGGERQSSTVAQVIWALESESLGAGKALAAALQQRPGGISPEGLLAIDESLRVLDSAISQSAAALREDPDNPRLMRRLTGYYRQRLSILRRATQVVTRA